MNIIQKIKDVVAPVGLAIGLTLLPSAEAAVGFDTEDFINGSNLILTNNTTINYGATNAVFVAKGGIYQAWSLSSSNIPVTIVGGTSYYTNTAVINTNVIMPQAWYDVDNYADRNGNVGGPSISITLAGDTAASTNALTFTFVRVPDGTEPETVTSAANPLTFIYAVTGATNMTFSTNLISAFSTGTARYRWRSVTAANSTTNQIVTIKKVRLNGFRQ